MVRSGKVDVKPLITHTYKLEETLQAFQRAKSGEGGAIKVCTILYYVVLGTYAIVTYVCVRVWSRISVNNICGSHR